MGDLGKLIVAKGFKKLPKVQKIAQSGHTVHDAPSCPAISLCVQVWVGGTVHLEKCSNFLSHILATFQTAIKWMEVSLSTSAFYLLSFHSYLRAKMCEEIFVIATGIVFQTWER